MPLLQATGIGKRYGTRAVLRDVDLALDAGAPLLLRGRSGSGKSTLLHILAGIEEPSSGKVEVAGRVLAELDEEERASLRLRQVGLVFQHFVLIPDLTAEENVRLPMVLARRPDAKARALDLLGRVDLARHARAFPSTLSGGEMQRVAIARALANDPPIILADEPTANLDETSARAVMGLLSELAKDRAVLVASHDPLAVPVFPRRAELREGALVERSGAQPGQGAGGERHGDPGHAGARGREGHDPKAKGKPEQDIAKVEQERDQGQREDQPKRRALGPPQATSKGPGPG